MKLEDVKAQLLNPKGLKWYYRATLISLFHSIKQVHEGVARAGHTNEGWGIRDTAKELNMSVGSVHGYVQLADALIAHPELKKLKLREALEKIHESEGNV